MDDEMIILAVIVIGVVMLKKKAQVSTGVTGITGNPGTLLNCCDANGELVDAGTSMYCPEGSTVC